MAEDEANPIAPPCSFRKDDLVTLVVGLEEEEFAVHESCITRTSEFFKAAMKKEWTEGQTRTIKLPEEPFLETFTHYLHYAYHRKLPTEDMNELVVKQKHFVHLMDIYVLGERMIDKSVQQAVIRESLRLTTLANDEERLMFPGPKAIATAYEGTCEGSGLRRFLVDLHVVERLATWSAVENMEFLQDYSKALLEKVLAQEKVLDFRDRKLVAEDYFD